MRPATFFSVLLFLFVSSLSLSTHAQTFDSKTIKLWEELEDKVTTIESLGEGLAFYDEHLAHIEVSDVTPAALGKSGNKWLGRACSEMFFNLALAAYMNGDSRWTMLKRHAEEMSVELMKSSDDSYQRHGVSAHGFFVQAATNLGEFEIAVQVLDAADLRIKEYFPPSKVPGALGIASSKRDRAGEFVRLQMANSLGDLATVERLLRSSMKEMEELGEMVAKVGGGGIATAGADVMKHNQYPELVSVLARQGKTGEAKEYLAAYMDFLERVNSSKGGIYNAFLEKGSVLVKTSKKSLADATLHIGEPELAYNYIQEAREQLEIEPSSQAGRELLSMFDQQWSKVWHGELLQAEISALWELKRFTELDQAVAGFRELRSELPDHNPHIMEARRMLLWSMLAQGDQESFDAKISNYAADQAHLIDYVFRFAPERQRLSLLQTIDPFSLIVAAKREDLLFPAIVKLKGVVLDSILEDRRNAAESDAGEARKLRDQLDRARRQLAAALIEGKAEALSSQKGRVESLERAFSALTPKNGSGRSALSVSVEDIQGRLSEDQAVLEFVQFNQMTDPGETRPHYGVAIFRKSEDPVWVALGDAGEIDKNIAAFADLMAPESGEFNDGEITSVLQSLNRQLIDPIAGKIAGVKTLLISPDAALGSLSFSVLLNEENQFACERWKIGYLSTSRDLLREATRPSTPGSLVVFADPEFARSTASSGESSLFAGRSVVFDAQTLPQLAPLPGTRTEMEKISSIASGKGFDVTEHSGSEALESKLRDWERSPDILHFATHGLVLPPTAAVSHMTEGSGEGVDRASRTDLSAGTGLADNSLRRSMLALAGAGDTFEQWAGGSAPDPFNDGLLSAEEVVGLNLQNTSLAVLSACDTGAGEALSGEGVFGLRRGFLMAGVDHLLMTFWPIADEQTAELMSSLYEKVTGSEHPVLALQQVQRESLENWKEEHGIGTAVYLAGPFALSTSGQLPSMK